MRATISHKEGWEIAEFAERYMDGRRCKHMGHTKKWVYTCTVRRRTKKPLFFGFPYATDTTRLIGVRELAIYSAH